MITTLLPWAALVLAILAWLTRDGEPKTASEDGGWMARLRPCMPHLWAAFGLFVIALAVGFFWKDEFKNVWPTSIGFAAGIAVAAASLKLGRLPGQPSNAVAAAAAIGVFGSAIWMLLEPAGREPYQLGAAAGVGLAAWLLGGVPGGSWPSRSSIFMVLALCADILGQRAAGGHSGQAGTAMGVMAVLGLILARGIPRNPENRARNHAIGIALAVVSFAGGSWLLATRHIYIHDLWIVFSGAALVGMVVAWLVPDEDTGLGSFNFILSVIIWLAVATLAFGLRRGYGMSVAALGGAAMLCVFGRTRAMLTLGPLAVIVVYRIFREMHNEASRALDIGQHYALIGLAIGAALPILVSEWRTFRASTGAKYALATALWAPILLAVPFVAGVVLAGKGYVGVIAGLGFGTVIEGLKGGSKLDVLSLQLGLSVALVGGYDWISDKLNLARDEKVSTLLYVVIGLGVLALAIALLTRNGGKEPAGSTE